MEYTADNLSDQFSWLRPLVVSVLSDESEADDVLQDMVLAAMRLGKPVRRSWMAKVARGLSIDVVRKRQSRARREQAAARAEAVDSAADVVERAATCQSLIDTVMDLNEPFRSTVLKRFWDNKSTSVIAQELGVSTDTVRLRLRKAQELVRLRMDSAHGGDRRAWAAPLLVHLATPGSMLAPAGGIAAAGAQTSGGLALGSRWMAGGLAVAGLALVGVAVATTLSSSGASPSTDSPLQNLRTSESIGSASAPAGLSPPRSNPSDSGSALSRREDTSARQSELVGQCIRSADDEPLVGIEVAVYEGDTTEPVARTTSAADGRFAVRFTRDSETIRVGFGGARMERVVEWDWPRHVPTLDLGAVPLAGEAHGLPRAFEDIAQRVFWLSMGPASTEQHNRETGRDPQPGIQAVVAVPQRLSVQVVDERSGLALETFGIELTPRSARWPSPPAWNSIELAPHPTGIAQVFAGTGPLTISIRPAPQSGLAPRRVALDELPTGNHLTVTLRPTRRRFEVQHAGSPLANVDVLLVERNDARLSAGTHRVVGAHPTDTDGAADALAPVDRTLLAAVRSAAWVAPLVEVWSGSDADPDPAPILLRASRAATLSGVIAGAGKTTSPERDLTAYLSPPPTRLDGDVWLLPEPAKVGPAGDFVLEGCPPGSWDVRLSYSLPLPGSAGRASYSVALGTIGGIQPADRRKYDAPPRSEWAPGQMHVTLLDEARQPLAHATIGIWADDPVTAAGFGHVGGLAAGTDAEGRLEPLWLPPGSYRLMHPATGARSDQPIVVTPEQVVDHDVRLRPRALEVSFCDATGQAFGDLDVSWSGRQLSDEEQANLAPIGRTDPNGLLRLDLLPSQPTHLYLRRNGNWEWAGLLDEELGSEQQTVAARVTVPRR